MHFSIKRLFGRITFKLGKVPYFKTLLPVVSMDICLLLFRNCKQPWKGLLFSINAYHRSLYLTFVLLISSAANLSYHQSQDEHQTWF